jgi:hypothetical protein
MLLVGATAIGLAGYRARRSFQRLPGIWWGLDVHQGAVWLAVSLSLAVLAIRLRPPRPLRRRLACQPGTAATVAAACTLALVLLERLEGYLFTLLKGFGSRPLDVQIIEDVGNTMTVCAGPAVAAAWTVLIVGRRWRPERSWIDRLGIALGLYWLLHGSISWLASALPDLLRWLGTALR